MKQIKQNEGFKSDYRKRSIKPLGAYFSKSLLRMGAYSGGGLIREWGLIDFCKKKKNK